MKTAHGTPSTQASRAVLWLLAANILGRIVWILYMHPKQLADFNWYFTHAVQLAHGQGYLGNNGHPTAYWPIGWPLILSAVMRIFGPHVMAGLIANAVLSTLIVWMVYHLGLKIFRNPRIAMAAAVGYSLLPSQIEWNSVLGSEESFTVLLVASLLVYIPLAQRNSQEPWFWRSALAGVIFGLGAIVRPIGLLFPVFLIACEWWVLRRRFGSAVGRGVTFGITMLLGILPVTIRNWVTMHAFVLVSTNGGVNLWQGTKINGGYFWTWNPYKNPLLKAKSNEVLENQIGKHTAIQYILHHPFQTIDRGIHKWIDLYKVDTNAVWYTFHTEHGDYKPVLYTFDIIDTLAYWFMMLLVIVGIVMLYRRYEQQTWRSMLIGPGLASAAGEIGTAGEQSATAGRGAGIHSTDGQLGMAEGGDGERMVRNARRAAAVLLTYIVYNTALFFFFPAWDRFRYPMMPLFAVFFGLGWVTARQWWKERRRLT